MKNEIGPAKIVTGLRLIKSTEVLCDMMDIWSIMVI